MLPTSQLLTKQQSTKLLADLRRIIGEGKQEAERAAAQALIDSYWSIGKRIHSAQRQQKGKPLTLPRPTDPSYLYKAEVRDVINAPSRDTS